MCDGIDVFPSLPCILMGCTVRLSALDSMLLFRIRLLSLPVDGPVLGRTMATAITVSWRRTSISVHPVDRHHQSVNGLLLTIAQCHDAVRLQQHAVLRGQDICP